MKEIKKEKQRKQQEQKRKRNIKRSIRKLFLGICLFLLGIFVYQCASKKNDTLSEYEVKVNEITDIDETKQQELLNAIVEEGKMNVNYSSKAIFMGKVSEQFNVKNIKNNHYPIVFELYDERGECLFESKKIAPGYEMTKIELNQALSKGIHECKLKVGYAEQGNVSSVFPITIEVKE